MDVHIRDLRYFVAVAQDLHFTRAAERLFVSQPALSKQIRLLERNLGAPLFIRDRRTVRLSAVGEALLPQAQAAIAAWDDALVTLRDAAARERSVLVVGTLTSVGRDLQRRVTETFTAGNPGWRLSLRLVGWQDPTAGLGDGSSDVAYLWLPVPGQEALETVVLFREARWVALSADHPLACRDEVAFADLVGEPFIALPPSAGPLRDYWLGMDAREGRPVHVAAEAGSADEALEAVTGGVGVALLSAGNARIYDRPGIVCRPVSGLSGSEMVVACRGDDRRPVVRAYLDACRAAVSGD